MGANDGGVGFSQVDFRMCDCLMLRPKHGHFFFGDGEGSMLPIFIPSVAFGASVLVNIYCDNANVERLADKMRAEGLPETLVGYHEDSEEARVKTHVFKVTLLNESLKRLNKSLPHLG